MSDWISPAKQFALADEAWGAELENQFGRHAGDARYDGRGNGKPGDRLNLLYLYRMKAMRNWERDRGLTA